MPVSEALAAILARVGALPAVESISLPAALGRVLAEDQLATVDVPPCDNSAMDGYALCFDDLQASGELPVSQRIVAGDAPGQLMNRHWLITDGEQTRFDFNLSFYGYLEGLNLEASPPRRFGPPAPLKSSSASPTPGCPMTGRRRWRRRRGSRLCRSI